MMVSSLRYVFQPAGSLMSPFDITWLTFSVSKLVVYELFPNKCSLFILGQFICFHSRACPVFQVLSEFFYSCTGCCPPLFPEGPPSPPLMDCHQLKPTLTCVWMSPKHLPSQQVLSLRILLCVWTHIIRGTKAGHSDRQITQGCLALYYWTTAVGIPWELVGNAESWGSLKTCWGWICSALHCKVVLILSLF